MVYLAWPEHKRAFDCRVDDPRQKRALLRAGWRLNKGVYNRRNFFSINEHDGRKFVFIRKTSDKSLVFSENGIIC
jgi:hypothetical protein